MTMSLFCSGELIRDPERKTSANGNNYVSALLRVDPETVVSLTAFDSGIAERLASLKKGSALACSGRLQARPYTDRDGTLRPGLGVTITELMIGAAPPQRAERRPRAKATPAAGAAGAGAGGDFDDVLPTF
ncbi:single-stranded DNA-binding protein [Plasticicumulans sp.]|uniref:single-stranded DNA-binding protein n=1 Tax=Plasticicumulans sp. TaxID=2307179 RepID=UPI003220263A